jgi:8-oxo-dGTP pyrophosphatase MutT (NUDIX family)
MIVEIELPTLSTKKIILLQPTSAGVIVINNDKTKLLLVKGKVKGKWGPPKGKIEHQEHTQTAAIRELYEETGIKLDIKDAVRYKNTNKPYQLYLSNIIFYIFYLNEDEYKIFNPVDTDEIIEVKWFSILELNKSINNGNYNSPMRFIYKNKYVQALLH